MVDGILAFNLVPYIPRDCESLGVGVLCVISTMHPSGHEVSAVPGDQRGLTAGQDP